ncbi:hypothetical protein PP641_gp082 [Arthrobacter phage SilentRX]|uniref:Uncharacterized protein n=1 Tax=Arthrobacter phage SilentRX TaxID=2836091 RepID=A0A8F3IPN1_9CAUD|nr:hypothetical protein PP641_gp082 [Arthrobacter phage SilentRX]QWY82822.1 hypothetical protein SEA_SILENTRX_82 [Arthrobacter phage SilentRX]
MLRHEEAQEIHGRIGAAMENFKHMPAGYTAADAAKELEPLLERALELAALAVADTAPAAVDHTPCIEGSIMANGRRSEFLIPLDNPDVTYSQWGADNTVLWPRVELLENMAAPAREWALDNLDREEDGDD